MEFALWNYPFVTTTMEATQTPIQETAQSELDILKQEVEALKNQIMTASLITELTKVMHASTNLQNTIQTILLGIHEIAGFDRIILFEIDKEGFALKPKAWFGIENEQISNISIPLGFEGGEITDSLFLNRHFLVKNISAGEDFFANRFSSSEYIVMPLMGRILTKFNDLENVESADDSVDKGAMAIFPAAASGTHISEDDRRKALIASDKIKAKNVFWMDRINNRTPITSDDIATLFLIVTQASIIIDNIQMFNIVQEVNANLLVLNKELREAHESINKELENARVIQQGLLPHSIPKTEDLFIAASYTPASAVSGDYYDAFEIAPGVFVIVVADVSGHGVSSALIMSMVKVLIKTFAFSINGPQKTLEQINKLMNREIKTNTFVTTFYAVLNTKNCTLQYSSAGHCPTIFYDKSTTTYTFKKADGLFLGVFDDMMLQESNFQFKPRNNRMILYTDGLVEAQNKSGEMFEITRLAEIGKSTLSLSANLACDAILEAQHAFTQNKNHPQDDITLLVIDF